MLCDAVLLFLFCDVCFKKLLMWDWGKLRCVSSKFIYTLGAEVQACDHQVCGEMKTTVLVCRRILRCALKSPKGRLVIFEISIDPEVT